MEIKQFIVPVAIAAVLIGAAVGIIALLTGFGSWKVQILLTDAIVAVGSICFLICWSAISARNHKVLAGISVAGVIASAMCTLLLLKFVWLESNNETLVKTTISSLVISLGIVYLVILNWFDSVDAPALSALGLVCNIGYAVIMVLMATFLVMIWVGIDVVSWKVVGIFGIILAACTILAPILHKSFITAYEKIEL